MVTRGKKPWLVLLVMVPIFLSLPTPVYSQNFLNPELLPEIDDLTFPGIGKPRIGNYSQKKQAMEQVELPTMAYPLSNNNPLALVKWNKTSISEIQSLVLGEIYFDAKRYFLKRDAAKIIEESAKLLEEDKTRELQIEAFCDRRGTNAYSIALGIHRASAVTRYLHSLGIPYKQFSATSFGLHQPRCQPRSSACWQDALRIDQAFHLLAMRRPKSGCLTRLRLNLGHTDRINTTHTTQQPFLQRIHLAELR